MFHHQQRSSETPRIEFNDPSALDRNDGSTHQSPNQRNNHLHNSATPRDHYNHRVSRLVEPLASRDQWEPNGPRGPDISRFTDPLLLRGRTRTREPDSPVAISGQRSNVLHVHHRRCDQ